MNMKEFLTAKYHNNEKFQTWKKKFPDMFKFSEEVEVVEWQPEYAIADYHAEVAEEINFWEMLAKNGLISTEEADKRIKEAFRQAKTNYANITLGIAFNKEKKVSFRKNTPPLWIALHELGHVYFDETDPIWSRVHGGGEDVMWAIIKGKVEGNEDSIRKWNNLIRLTYENPEKALKILDEYALKVAKQRGIDIESPERIKYLCMGRPKKLQRPIIALIDAAGTYISDDTDVNPAWLCALSILEGLEDPGFSPLYTELLQEIIR